MINIFESVVKRLTEAWRSEEPSGAVSPFGATADDPCTSATAFAWDARHPSVMNRSRCRSVHCWQDRNPIFGGSKGRIKARGFGGGVKT